HDVVGVQTVRDPDGLALSSRNTYLTEEQRAKAAVLPKVMKDAAKAIAAGENLSVVLDNAKTRLLASGFHKIDYLELRNAIDLSVLDVFTNPARLFVAARIGQTRLIDNIPIS
ncbi:MAG: pantoate--beta-alanine ligase, partial [Parasphingorhabdus sp.]